MIDFDFACKIAYDYYREMWKCEGLKSARDLGELWLFYPVDDRPFFGDSRITVSKDTGEIRLFPLPNRKNFELLKESSAIEIPAEYN